MADKVKQQPVQGMKPVPMKLFSTWEVDRTPPNCVPRLCSLTLSRLVLLKPLGNEITSICIAVKMQDSRRTLRSNQMALGSNGLLDTELQLSFSLQYPHFLKQGGNKLHVMLQRRKRYKNRTILGYKTLADGVVEMSRVLQRPLDLELDLFTETKGTKHYTIAARVTVNSLSSHPVDHDRSTIEEPSKTTRHVTRIGDYSDEEEEYSSNDDGSDYDQLLEDNEVRETMLPATVRQRNLKQRFIALLKRFRANEDFHGLDDSSCRAMGSGGDTNTAEIEDILKELELSDSGQELDTMSIASAPKPSLKPFFSSSHSLIHNTADST